MTEISNLIEEYIECPEENLMMSFEGDKWGGRIFFECVTEGLERDDLRRYEMQQRIKE